MPLLHPILAWLVSAPAMWIVARIIPGIEVRSFATALVAAAMIPESSMLTWEHLC